MLNDLLDLPIAPVQRELAIAQNLRRDTAYDLDDPVITHVRRHAANHPDAIAVVDDNETISYQELVLRAEVLAGVLRDAGAGGSVVAVTGPRCGAVIAAFLAIELAGAVYLPIDRGWPQRRQRDVLQRSGATLVLVSQGDGAVVRQAAESLGRTVVRCDQATAEPWGDQPALANIDQVRYVLYTSGSTGAPKGALVEHRGMLNHLFAKVDDLGLTGTDRVAQTAPLGFDISLWQMLAPLVAGARVDVFDDDIAQDPARLVAELERRAVTVAETVPTLLQLITEELRHHPAPLPALRWMLATGEELYPAVARGWLRTAPHSRLMNAYGPTECSDDVTHHVVTLPQTEKSRLAIGTPVANTALYVLAESDDGWHACGVGDTGELFVGGVCVGRGYLNEPERTRKAFYRDPFTEGGRLYRTGDLVRLTPEGALEYLGRVDRQVKVGGVRMELGEIEAVLHDHAAVEGCAVRMWRPTADAGLLSRETAFDGSGPPARLAAYVSGDAGMDLAAVKRHCAERLPSAMVPATISFVESIPLSHNGKVDYDALPEPSGPTVVRPAYVPPAGEAETAVAEAITEVLGVRIGRDESFTLLGGDSLRGMRVASTLRARGHQANLRDILTEQTPRAIATHVHPLETHRIARERPVPDEVRRLPATPFQAYLHDSWTGAKGNPAFAYQGTLRMTGAVDFDQLAEAWRVVLAENPVLTARWFAEDGKVLHEFPAHEIPLPRAIDLSALDAEHRDKLYRDTALAATTEPFELAEESPLRVQLFRFGPADHRLLLTVHEVMLDGWGVTLFVDRLSELYGQAVFDPGRARRYDDYLAWQQESLADPARRAVWSHWRDEVPTPPLFTGRGTHRSSVVERLVSAETMEAIRVTCAEFGLTPFMVLLGAYTLALTAGRGRNEITVLAPIANRDAPEQADVPAFLLNFLPLRVSTEPEDTVEVFLRRLKESVGRGYAAADCPTSWMSDEERTFDVVLNLLTYPARRREVSGVEFGYTVHDHGYTKTPCVLYGQEHWSGGLVLQLAHQENVVSEEEAHDIADRTTAGLAVLIGPKSSRLS